MKEQVCRAAVAACAVACGINTEASGATASNFAIAVLDFSDVAGSFANGLSVTGEFFNSPFGGNAGSNINSNLWNISPEAEFDTYSDISGAGPVTLTTPGNQTVGYSLGDGFVGSQTNGLTQQFGNGGATSGALDFDFGTRQALFLGRFTYTGELSGDIGLGVIRLDGLSQSEGGFSNGLGYLLELGETFTFSSGDTVSLITVDVDNSSVASLDGFTTTDVYAVLNIPSPGAASVLGGAGLAALRRRR